MVRKATRRRRGRNTGRSSLALENAVDNLHSVGFEILTYSQYQQRENEGSLPTDYVVRRWPHPSLWQTPGHKEALIVTSRNRNGKFLGEEVDGTKIIRIVLEAKYQDTSGSVDEKIPYIWFAFQSSEIPNWIALYDGKFWQTSRGSRGIQWLKNMMINNKLFSKSLQVLDRREFSELVGKTWR